MLCKVQCMAWHFALLASFNQYICVQNKWDVSHSIECFRDESMRDLCYSHSLSNKSKGKHTIQERKKNTQRLPAMVSTENILDGILCLYAYTYPRQWMPDECKIPLLK